jgi:cell division protein FtsB
MSAVSRRFARVVLALLPAMIILSIAFQAVVGSDGLMRRHVRERQLASVQTATTTISSENLRLRREIRLLQESPDAVRREAFEVLYMAPAGSVIYVFPGEAAERTTR